MQNSIYANIEMQILKDYFVCNAIKKQSKIEGAKFSLANSAS